MRGDDLDDDVLAQLKDLAALQVVRRYPVRIKCAPAALDGPGGGVGRVAQRRPGLTHHGVIGYHSEWGGRAINSAMASRGGRFSKRMR